MDLILIEHNIDGIEIDLIMILNSMLDLALGIKEHMVITFFFFLSFAVKDLVERLSGILFIKYLI